MKIIKLFSEKNQLLELLKQQDRKSQQFVFELYAPKMLMICRRYIKDIYLAEDIMLQGFLKVFTQIHQLNEVVKLEPWIKKIMVNTCLDTLRKQKNMFEDLSENYAETLEDPDEDNQTDYELETIINALDCLPIGAKTVFNLYYVESKKHKEIAKLLNISENTSKTQLAYAKKLLRQLLNPNKVQKNIS